MSAAELARQLHVPTKRVKKIKQVRRAVKTHTALRLEHFFRMSPQFWINLQMSYDLRVAQRASGSLVEGLPTMKTA